MSKTKKKSNKETKKIDKDQFKDVGRFIPVEWMPGEMQGNNFVRSLHSNFRVMGPDMPDDIGIRIIEIPPMGEIPVHDHDTDEFSSWVFCIEGSGEHLVEIEGERYVHPFTAPGGSVSTQKMLTDYNLQYRHGFKAGENGAKLMNIFRRSEVTDERLAEIQRG